MIETTYYNAKLILHHLGSSKACVAVDVANIRSNTNNLVFLYERKICGQQTIY